MSEQNREDEFTDPTSPAPDPGWQQPAGSTSPPPPKPWTSQQGSEPDSDSPAESAQPESGTTPAADPSSTVPPPPPAGAPYGTPPPPSGGAPYPQQGQTPYGSAPSGNQNPPYGTPPPAYYAQAPSQSNTSALVLTILSGIGVFACCGVTIVSLILGIIAITKQSTDPEQSAKLAKWGWIAFAVGLVLAVLGTIAYFGFMIALTPGLSGY